MSRTLTSLLGGLCLVTICWVFWAFETPGDYFANGNEAMLPSLIAAALIGVVVGWTAKGRIRLTIQLLSLVSICYWIFVPAGWWVHSPFR